MAGEQWRRQMVVAWYCHFCRDTFFFFLAICPLTLSYVSAQHFFCVPTKPVSSKQLIYAAFLWQSFFLEPFQLSLVSLSFFSILLYFSIFFHCSCPFGALRLGFQLRCFVVFSFTFSSLGCPLPHSPNDHFSFLLGLLSSIRSS